MLFRSRTDERNHSDYLTLGGDRRYHVALYDESEGEQRNDGAQEVGGERRAIEPLRKDRTPMMCRFFHDFTPIRASDAAPPSLHRPPANPAKVVSVGDLSRAERLIGKVRAVPAGDGAAGLIGPR